MSNKIIGIIPARYGSTRFPGKPLAMIEDKPMIQRVYEQAKKSKLLTRVIVATDDRRIYWRVKDFGGEVYITSKKHKSGTDRIGEIVKKRKSDFVDCELIVNIQGDEPFIDPKNIDKAIKPLLKDKTINVSTLCTEIKNQNHIKCPNTVKVVFDKDNFTLYFSRSPIPYNMKGGNEINYYKHIGLYVYRKDFLLKFISMKPSKLEKAENLEQLRILEKGERIKIVMTKNNSRAIDTPEDLKGNIYYSI